MSPTAIEWTEETWNPVTGCSNVSPGCDNCYAETLSMARRPAIQPSPRDEGKPAEGKAG